MTNKFIHNITEAEGAGIIVVRKKNNSWKVLGLWAKGGFDIPKGHIEPEEEIFNTALRETYEETKINKLNFQWGQEYIRMKNLFIFVASTTQDPEVTKNPEQNIFEHEYAEWLEWEEMKDKCYKYLLPAIQWAEMKTQNEA